MKILIVGGGGQVARALVGSAPPGHHIVTKSRGDLDIADSAGVSRALQVSGADWLINAAAYTAVDLAEDEPAKAEAINATAVKVLAEAAAAARCRLLHLSTDFVFDGESSHAYAPSDPTHPLSVYGASKLHGETAALQAPGAIVLRTAWVYAAQGKNFVLTMLRLMRERSEVRVVCDQIGAPTWATGLAGALWALVDADAPAGIYHWTDLGVASWYDFAVAIQEEGVARGLLPKAVPVIPIPSSAYPTRARRPTFSVLDTRATRELTKAPSRHWRDSLRMMMDELRAP